MYIVYTTNNSSCELHFVNFTVWCMILMIGNLFALSWKSHVASKLNSSMRQTITNIYIPKIWDRALKESITSQMRDISDFYQSFAVPITKWTAQTQFLFCHIWSYLYSNETLGEAMSFLALTLPIPSLVSVRSTKLGRSVSNSGRNWSGLTNLSEKSKTKRGYGLCCKAELSELAPVASAAYGVLLLGGGLFACKYRLMISPQFWSGFAHSH